MRALRESFTIELTNPKSAVYFIDFLPKFSDPGASQPVWLQIVLLGIIANAVFTAAEAAGVLFAAKVASFVRTSRATGRWMRRVAGTILLALGAKLIVADR